MGFTRNILVWSTVVWALLATSGAALDWYDEPARPLNADIYQNYNAASAARSLAAEEDNKDGVDDMGRAMLLYKIMQSLKISRDIAGQYRPNPDTVDYVDDELPMNIKVTKRGAKPAQSDKPKLAKAKTTRAPAMCYLKLCSYRGRF